MDSSSWSCSGKPRYENACSSSEDIDLRRVVQVLLLACRIVAVITSYVSGLCDELQML